MATPKPIYCDLCGCFTGDHRMTGGDEKSVSGRHIETTDCLRNLNLRIHRLEEVLHEADAALRQRGSSERISLA